MKTTHMTVIGAGHKIAAIAFPVLAVTITLGCIFPGLLHFGPLSRPLLIGTGLGLVVIGLGINFSSAVLMMAAFRSGRLATIGPYAVSRNPMYTSFIIFTIPGIALALNNWAVLAASAALYGAIQLFINEEEHWLEKQFGQAWADYANRVGRIFPRCR